MFNSWKLLVKMSKRTRSKSTAPQEMDSEHDDDGAIDVFDTARKKFSYEEEDCLLAIIRKHIDVIEKKSTDKSLSPQKLKTAQQNAWTQIAKEHKQKTGVSFL